MIATFMLSVMMVGYSLPMVWWNEQKEVKMNKLIKHAKRMCVPNVSVDSADPQLDYRLIHCRGMLTTDKFCTDEEFGININAVKLVRDVECY